MSRSNTGRKIFVANMGYHDFSLAKKWGDLVPVTTGRVDVMHTDRLEARLQEVLHEAEEKDYILLSGGLVINALCIGYLFAKFGRVRMIFWDALLQDYHLRETDFSEKNESSG